jgi:hypothetical protein
VYINLWDELHKKLSRNKGIIFLHNKGKISILIKPIDKTHCIITFMKNAKITLESNKISNDYMHLYFYNMNMKNFRIYYTTKPLKLEDEND